MYKKYKSSRLPKLLFHSYRFFYREVEEPDNSPTPLETEPTVIVEEKTSMAIEETIVQNREETESITPQVR